MFPFLIKDTIVDPSLYNQDYLKQKRLNEAVTLTAIGAAHFFPCLLVAIDLRSSSIKFYRRHLVLIILLAALYLAYHLFQTFYLLGPTKSPIYPSHDWYNNPVRSSVLTAVSFAILVLIFQGLVCYTERKISAKFPGGQTFGSDADVEDYDTPSKPNLSH